MTLAAIVTAYDEAPRIKPVIEALQSCELISEIIVVNDGSKDDLDNVMKHFP